MLILDTSAFERALFTSGHRTTSAPTPMLDPKTGKPRLPGTTLSLENMLLTLPLPDNTPLPECMMHNAGNDAVYTMWAMLAISVQAAAERDTEEARIKNEERELAKMQKAVEAAKERVKEESEGWDLDDDGGAPLPQAPSKSGHYTAGGAPLDI